MKLGPKFYARIIGVVVLILAYYPKFVSAGSFTTYGPTDYYFVFNTSQKLEVRTYAVQFGIDSALWLYDTRTGDLVAYNDDYYGLDSFISYDAESEVTYRLRTGVCCGDPDRWYGEFYFVEMNSEPFPPVTETTDTVPVETAPETVPPTETSTTTTTEYVEPSVPSTPPETVPETTTTEPQTTTTSVVVVTTSSTTTSTSTVPPQPTTTQPTQTTTTQVQIPWSTTIPEETTTTTVTLPEIPVTPVADYVADALQELDASEAKEFFEQIKYDALSDEELGALVDVLNEQSDDIKEEFEDTVNVFGGKFEKYVPSGSNINVQQRKVLIAATGVLFLAPSVPSTTGSASSVSRKSGR